MRYTAEILVRMSVTFEDDGVSALCDQAHDAAMLCSIDPFDCEIEVQGEPEPLAAQPRAGEEG